MLSRFHRIAERNGRTDRRAELLLSISSASLLTRIKKGLRRKNTTLQRTGSDGMDVFLRKYEGD